MSNPDPARITDEMWQLWESASSVLPGVKLSGIYAFKKGYHSSVKENLEHWSDNYSVALGIDRYCTTNRDKARAIDLTLSDAEMIKWTTRMRDSAVDPKDDRLDAVKEFYGTLDGKTVFGLKKDDPQGSWTHSSADSTHLWHGHTSIFTPFVSVWLKLAPLVSVWRGQSLSEWRLSSLLPISKGDKGENVRYWQHIHNYARSVIPGLPQLEADGEYGPNMQAAIKYFWAAVGGTGQYDGSYLHGWTAVMYHRIFVQSQTKNTTPSPIDPAQLTALVNEWLKANIPGKLSIAGDFEGKVSLQ